MGGTMQSAARGLRKNPTEAERLLWRHLRLRQLGGHKFRRQQPLGPYIVDFVCLEKRLIVEVDGGHHAAQVAKDAQRAAWLTSPLLNPPPQGGRMNDTPRPYLSPVSNGFQANVDLTSVLSYLAAMSEELSKRIDDLHKRFDHLRADMNQRFGELRAHMAHRFEAVDRRLNDLNQRFTDMQGTLRTFMWIVSAWFTFLTAVLAVFGFLRR